MNIYTIMGDTCSGKTTHGKLIAKKHNFKYISSGDIARSFMDADTAGLFKDGQLSPHGDKIEERIFDLMDDADRSKRDVLLDGFPRTLGGLAILNLWKDRIWPASPKMAAIMLNIPLSVIQKRAQGRKRDAFDTMEAVEKRHQLFVKETMPVFDELDDKRWLKLQLTLTQELPVEAVQEGVEAAVIYVNKAV